MNTKILYIVIIAVVVIGGGAFFVLNNQGAPQETQTPASETEMVDCGMMTNPTCFANRMNGCLPVTAKLTGNDGSSIEITILGIENEKCHFQRKVNNVQDLNCYFPKGTMNWDTIDQTFGNDKGLQSVVDESCQSGW